MQSRRPSLWLLTCALLALVSAGPRGTAQVPQAPTLPSPWAEWVEPDFPFFSSVLDARSAGPGLPADNLTPRALILNLGNDHWAAFDTDLLRVAAIWQGSGVTPVALAPGSYHHPDRKTPGGQSPLPEPVGHVWFANGIYAGWQVGDTPVLEDTREPAPSPEEVGRGPLSEETGRLSAIRLVDDGVVLDYTAGGVPVKDWFVSVAAADGTPRRVERRLEVGPSTRPLVLVLGVGAPSATATACTHTGEVEPLLVPVPRSAVVSGGEQTAADVRALRIPPHADTIRVCIAYWNADSRVLLFPRQESAPIPDRPARTRWPQELRTTVARAAATGAYVVDDIALPVENPWRRNVRPGDIQFRQDGTGVLVTLDGDVWLVRGLHDSADRVRWKRFASGLHEPLTLAIRDDEIFVYDRNGIWRLRDTNGDGEADAHELFSNAFAQTADMREFPNTIRLAPGGEFVIAKGNQQATTIGKHNGTVLRVSADGRRATVLGYGFRQPNIGVNVRTGLVTASDQQGHYIPTTPLHIVRDNQFYGFLPDKQPREIYPAPIAEPLTWIPHTVNASAMSQVWLFGAQMGPLSDGLVHIGFNNPELFRVLIDERGSRPQAAMVSVTRAFEFPPLNGAVNPADGQLYLAGFQVQGWGTSATRLAGLGRVRYTGADVTLPREVVATDRGMLLRFDVPLDRAAAGPDRFTLASWSYRRTYRYGSPQYRADGSTGIDRLAPSATYVSHDRKSVFVGVPGMTPVMQMRVGWSLTTARGEVFQGDAYFTPYELRTFEPRASGFGDLTVDLTPRTVVAQGPSTVSAEEGRRLYQAYGCIACHAAEPDAPARLGPSFHGLWGRERTFAGGVLNAMADDAYLRESILEPSAKIVSGYETGGAGMPSYAGVLTDPQIESLILFIRSLQ